MDEDTTQWSPAWQRLVTAMKVAIWPEVVSIAAAPPSSAAIFCSTAAQVGLEMRLYMWLSSGWSKSSATASVVS